MSKTKTNKKIKNKEVSEISYEQAVKLLYDSEKVHTFISFGPMLMGCDVNKNEILDKLKKAPEIKLTGPNMSRAKHNLAIWDNNQWLFIESKKYKNS